MNVAFKIAAVFLLISLLGFSSAAMPQVVQSGQMAGGCHDGSEMPAPQTPNFHCCQAGHNTAILQSVHHEELVVFGTVPQDKSSAVKFQNCSTVAGWLEDIPLADHPPGGLTLRI